MGAAQGREESPELEGREESPESEGRCFDLPPPPELPPNWKKDETSQGTFYWNTNDSDELTFDKPVFKLDGITGKRYWELTNVGSANDSKIVYYDNEESGALESLKVKIRLLKDAGLVLHLDENGRRYWQSSTTRKYLDNVHESGLTGYMGKKNYHKKKYNRKIPQKKKNKKNKKKKTKINKKKGKKTRRKKKK